MSRRRIRRQLVVACLLPALMPTLVLAQQPARPAGVVTALTGQATVTRVALPRPGSESLKFRDPVYPRDRITTREQSLVRVLLGGKAVVTVRELSNLTITEEPGRPSVIDILSGKIALVVARLRMGPTDAIEVRTPNAVAAIRGTVVVVEVTPEPTAQASPGVPTVFRSVLHVLAGSILVQSLLQPGAPPIPVGAGFSLTAIGAAVGAPAPSPPRAEILQGLTAPASSHTDTPESTRQALGQTGQIQAQTLAAVLTGDLNLTNLQPPATKPSSTGDIGVNAQNALGALQEAAPTEPVPFFTISNSNLQVPGGSNLARFTSGGVPVAPEPGSISDLGMPPAPPYNFGSCAPPATPCAPVLSGTGPDHLPVGPNGGATLALHNTTVNLGGSPLIVVEDTNVGATTLLTIDPSHVRGGSVLGVQSAGTLVAATIASVGPGSTIVTGNRPVATVQQGSNLVVGGALVDATGPGAAVNTGTAPVLDLRNRSTGILGAGVRLAGGTLTAGSLAAGDGSGNALTIASTALDLANATATLAAPFLLGPPDVLALALTANVPAFRLAGSTLTLTQTDASLATLAGAVPGTGVEVTAGSTLDLKGPALVLGRGVYTATNPMFLFANSIVRQTGTSEALLKVDPAGGTTALAAPLLKGQESSFNVTGPLAQFTSSGDGGTITGPAGQALLKLRRGAGDPAGLIQVDGGVALKLNGSLVDAVDNVGELGSSGDFLAIGGGATVTTAGTAAALVAAAGVFTNVGGSTIHVSGAGAAATLSGPALTTSGNTLNVLSDVLQVDGGAIVTGQGAGALIQANGATVNAGRVLGASDALTTVTAQGGLLSAAGASNINLGGSLAGLSGGAKVILGGRLVHLPSGAPRVTVGGHVLDVDAASTVTGPPGGIPLIEVAATSATGLCGLCAQSGALVNLAGRLTLTGPILLQSGGVVSAFEGLGLAAGAALGPLALSGALFQVSGGRLTTNFDTLVNIPPTASLNLNAGIVDVNGTGQVTSTGTMVIAAGTLTQTGTQPLARVSGAGTLNITGGGDALGVPASGAATLGGSVLGLSSGSPTVNVGGHGVNVSGTLTGPPAGRALVDVAATSAAGLSAAGSLANLDGGAATLTGSILAQEGGVVGAASALALAAGASLAVIPAGQTVTGTVGVGQAPLGIAVTRDGTRAYVANGGADTSDRTISVINTATNTVVGTITVFSNAGHIAVTPDGARLYVSNVLSSRVSVVDTATNTEITTIAVGGNPREVAITPDGTRAYVANQSSSTVSVISTATNTVTATIPVGNGPFGLAMTPGGTRAYVANQNDNSISVIDTDPLSPTFNTVIGSPVAVGNRPFQVAITPDGTRAYVANRDSNTVSVINTATNTVVATVPVGQAPRTVAISPDGTRAYVANRDSDSVSVIDTATHTVIGTLVVGDRPFGIAFTPDGTRGYVANENAGNISVLSVTAGESRSLVRVAGGTFTTTGGVATVPAGTALTVPASVLEVSGPGSVRANANVLEVGGTLTGGATALVTVSGGGRVTTVGAGSDLVRVSGGTARLGAGGVLAATGRSTADIAGNVMTAENAATVNGTGTGFLVRVSDSTLNAANALDARNPGTTVQWPGGLLGVASTVNLSASIALVEDGAQVTLGGPGLNLTGGTVTGTSGQAAFRVADATSRLQTTGAASHLARASGGTSAITWNGPFLSLQDVATGNVSVGSGTVVKLEAGARLTVAGSFVDMTNSVVNLPGPVAIVEGGSTLRNTIGPAFRISGGSLTAGALGITDSTGNTISLTGTLLDLSNTTVTLRRLGQEVPDNEADTFRITLGADEPFLKVQNSTLIIQEGDILSIGAAETGSPFRGVALVADPSTITLGGRLVEFFGTVAVTGAMPLVQLDQTVLKMPGPKSLIDAQPGAQATTTKPLLNALNSTIDTVNPSYNTVVATVGGIRDGVAITRDGKRAYVADRVADTVSVVDTATNTIIATVPLGAGSDPVNPILTPDGSRAYVTHFTNPGSVSVINTATNSVITTIPVGGSPVGGAITPDGARAYVANRDSNSVSVIDTNPASPTFNTVIRTVGVGAGPHDVAITPDGSRAYVTNNSSATVSVIDTNPASPTFNTVVSTVGVGAGPIGVALTPDGRRAFVANDGEPKLSVIDTNPASPTFHTVLATVNVGANARRVAITPDGTRAYVVHFGTGQVSIVDIPSNRVLATVAVETNPHTLAIAPDGARAYVVNFGSATVSVVDTNPAAALLTIGTTGAGASLVSTGSAALLRFDPTTVNTGNLVRIEGTPPAGLDSLRLAGSLVDATDTAFTTVPERSFILIRDGARLTTAGTADPLLRFTGTAPGQSRVTAGRNFLALSTSAPGLPAPAMTLSGSMLAAVQTNFTTGDPTRNTFTFLFVGDGATLTGMGGDSLLSFDNSSVDTAGNIVTVRRSPSAGTPSRLALAGSLFTALNGSTFDTSSLGAGSACCAGFLVSQGAQLSSTSPNTLIHLDNTTFRAGPDAQSGATFFLLGDTFPNAAGGELVAPATVSVNGSLIEAVDSTLTALFSLVGITRSSLTGTGGDPLIVARGAGTTIAVGGADPFVPGPPAFSSVFFATGATGGSNAPAAINLAGGLLRVEDATVSATGHLVSLVSGAILASSGAGPLIEFRGAATVSAGDPALAGSGRMVSLTGLGGAAGTTPSSLSVAGPLLRTEGGTNATFRSSVIGAGNGASITGAGPEAFVQMDGGTLSSTTGRLVHLSDAGTTMTLAGGLLQTVGAGTVTVADALADLGAGTSLTLGGPLVEALAPGVVQPAGDVAKVAGTLTGGGEALVKVQGAATMRDPDLTPPGPVGTDQPLRPGGALLQSAGGTTSVTRIAKLDTALLEASLPLLNLTAGAVLTTGQDAFDLARQAHVRTNPLASIDLIRLDGINTRLTVNNGHLVNVAASKLEVSGHFLSMSNGARLDIVNGLLLNVRDGGFARIAGSLVNFTGAGNVINLNNSLPVTSVVNGIPVFSSLGGSAGFTITGTPLAGLGPRGAINVNGVACVGTCANVNRPLIAIQGTGGTVQIGPPL